MRRSLNACRFIAVAALLVGVMPLLAACDTAATTSSVGPGADMSGRPPPAGAEATMAEPSPVGPSAPVSPLLATPGIFSPGPAASSE